MPINRKKITLPMKVKNIAHESKKTLLINRKNDAHKYKNIAHKCKKLCQKC